jgi:hypothetical protein
MRIRDIIEQTDFELANQEPSAEDVDAIKDFIDTIDPQTDTPQQVLTRLQQLQQEYPLLDRITDMIPQTRMVKQIALAVDSLVANKPMAALSHLGRVIGGGVATAAAVAHAAQSLSKGDIKGAAQQAFGATQIGRDYNRGQQVAQRVGKAAQALADPAQAYTDLRNRILPQQAPAPVADKTNELERLRQLSGQS